MEREGEADAPDAVPKLENPPIIDAADGALMIMGADSPLLEDSAASDGGGAMEGCLGGGAGVGYSHLTRSLILGASGATGRFMTGRIGAPGERKLDMFNGEHVLFFSPSENEQLTGGALPDFCEITILRA